MISRHRGGSSTAFLAPGEGADLTVTSSSTAVRSLEKLVAVIAVFALAVRIPLLQGITPGYILALALAPLWFSSLRTFRGARFLFWVAVACAPAAWVLVSLNSDDHRFNINVFLGRMTLLLGLACGLGLLLWAQQVVSPRLVGFVYGAGMLFSQLVRPGDLTEENPLKFAVALPAAIMILSVLHRRDRRGAQMIGVLALAIFGTLVDARSFFAICLLTLALVAWQARPVIQTRPGSWALTTLFIATLGAGVYYLGTTLAVDGYLGVETQQRSIAQIEVSGSLILGGRPELGATAALMEREPWGFGAGTIPNLMDVTTAKKGMASLGYDPNNGYVDNYLFGTGVNLHSLIGDTWASFGIAGLLLTGSAFFLMVRGAATRISERRASALVILLTSYGLWNTFFSPLPASLPILTLGLAFLLEPIDERRTRQSALTPQRREDELPRRSGP